MDDYGTRMPSDNDPVLGRNGSPFGYLQLGLDAMRPSNVVPWFNDTVMRGQKTKASAQLDDHIAETQKNEIVPPELVESAKTGKVKDNDMELAQRLIMQGINPVTNPQKFLEAFGATAAQNGIARTWGPLQGIRSALSSGFQSFKARQEGLLQVGTYLTNKILDLQVSRLGAPQTLEQANAMTPGLVQPLPDQMRSPGPYADQLRTEPSVDPGAQLKPFQQDLAVMGMKNLAGGQLMVTPEGIVPTSYAAAQGRNLSPEMVDWADRAALVPPTEQLPQPPMGTPPAVLNKVVEERGQRLRAAEQRKNRQIDYSKRVEELAAVESKAKYGKVMNFGQLAEVDNGLAREITNKAQLEIPEAIYDAQLRGQLRIAGTKAYASETGRAEAELDQSLKEPQLWRDPYTGQAAPSTMTERQARKEGRVKLRPDQIETINQLSTVDDGLEEIKRLASKVMFPKADTPAGEMLRTLGQNGYIYYLRGIGDKNIVKMDSIISRLTAPLVKSQGDTANIAVAERDMFAKALVNKNASLEAVLENLDSVIMSTKKARNMMGFKSVQDFVAELLRQGVPKDEIPDILKKRGLVNASQSKP